VCIYFLDNKPVILPSLSDLRHPFDLAGDFVGEDVFLNEVAKMGMYLKIFLLVSSTFNVVPS
jgi:hypothetical protein